MDWLAEDAGPLLEDAPTEEDWTTNEVDEWIIDDEEDVDGVPLSLSSWGGGHASIGRSNVSDHDR